MYPEVKLFCKHSADLLLADRNTRLYPVSIFTKIGTKLHKLFSRNFPMNSFYVLVCLYETSIYNKVFYSPGNFIHNLVKHSWYLAVNDKDISKKS